MNSGARVWHLRLRINRLLPMRLIRRNLSMRMRVCRERPVNAAGESPAQGGVGTPW
jgi:hypothetical protein